LRLARPFAVASSAVSAPDGQIDSVRGEKAQGAGNARLAVNIASIVVVDIEGRDGRMCLLPARPGTHQRSASRHAVDRRSLGDDAVHVEDEGSCPARDASAFSPVALSPASPAVATVCSNWAFTTKLTGARFSTYDAARTRIDEPLRRYGPLGAKHAIGFVPSTTGGHLATYDVVIEQPYESMGVIAPAALIGLCHNLAQTGSTLGTACGRCARRRAADQGEILPVAGTRDGLHCGLFTHWCT
jgi:hypothetical protein